MTKAQLPTTRRYGKVFDAVAAEYDRNRPTYPSELIDQACQVAGVTPGDPVLEVGCGSGQLTRDLMARGLNVTALEPGKQLLSLAEQNLRGSGAVEFVNALFEDAPLPKGHFKAVFSATAFHWVNPDVSWQKAADVLAPGGTLVLIQHRGLQEERTARDQAMLLAALAKVVPEIAAKLPSYEDLASIIAEVERRRDNVSEVWGWIGNYDLARPYASHLFDDVQVAVVPVLIEQTADELNALLRTTSLYTRFSPQQRRDLEAETVAIYQQLGRPIRSSLAAIVVTARRSAAN